jgi:hypothetical protein
MPLKLVPNAARHLTVRFIASGRAAKWITNVKLVPPGSHDGDSGFCPAEDGLIGS